MKKNLYGKRYYKDYKISNYNDYEIYRNHPYFKALLNYILKYKKRGRLLEIGCAYGFFLQHAEKHFKTYGIDISKYAISQAKKNTKKTKLYVGDIEKTFEKYFKNNKFDIIIALDVLEHLKNPEKIIKLFYKCLNKEGILFFKVPNKSSIILKYYNLIGKKNSWTGYKDKTHISLFDQNKWKKIIRNIGFRYKIIVHIPTKYLKKFFVKNQFFLHSRLNFLNESVSFLCYKK